MTRFTLHAVFLATGLILAGLILANPSLADDQQDHRPRPASAGSGRKSCPCRHCWHASSSSIPARSWRSNWKTPARSLGAYQIKLLRSNGALVKLEIDARDGSILRSKTKNQSRQGEPLPCASCRSR